VDEYLVACLACSVPFNALLVFLQIAQAPEQERERESLSIVACDAIKNDLEGTSSQGTLQLTTSQGVGLRNFINQCVFCPSVPSGLPLALLPSTCFYTTPSFRRKAILSMTACRGRGMKGHGSRDTSKSRLACKSRDFVQQLKTWCTPRYLNPQASRRCHLEGSLA
jgi:hypothetical protein